MLARSLLVLGMSFVACLSAAAQEGANGEGTEAEPALALELSVLKETVLLGESIPLVVTVRNTGAAPAHCSHPILLDTLGLDFQVKSAELAFTWTVRRSLKFYNRYLPAEAWTLPPGAEDRFLFEFPTVGAGEFEFTARFHALGAPVTSEARTVQVRQEPGHEQVVAVLDTSSGSITIAFFPQKAPNTVLSFVRLVRNGFYDGKIFHRVMKGFIIQGGCPQGIGTYGPGYTLPAEFDTELPHEPGVVSMARGEDDPNSAGCQFFICLPPSEDGEASLKHLDGKYAAFGRVIEGMETVEAIGQVAVEPVEPEGEVSRPVARVVILKATLQVR